MIPSLGASCFSGTAWPLRLVRFVNGNGIYVPNPDVIEQWRKHEKKKG
jgi:hypothetical protein